MNFSHLKPGTDPYASLFKPHRRSGHFFNKVPVARDVAPKDVLHKLLITKRNYE